MKMSLLKIPLILSSAVAVHVALTPPHAPSKNEVVHDTFNEWVIIQHVRYGLPISKVPVYDRPQSSLMELRPDSLLGYFFGRNSSHRVSYDGPQNTSQRGANLNRSISSKNPGRANHSSFHSRYRTCCLSGIPPLVVFSDPWSFLHIRAYRPQGSPACHEWTIFDRTPSLLRSCYSAVYRCNGLTRICDFVG